MPVGDVPPVDFSQPLRLGPLLDWAVAAIAYTSGTTGNPKGVMHSQHNALLPGAVAVSRGSYEEDDVFLCVQPLTCGGSGHRKPVSRDIGNSGG